MTVGFYSPLPPARSGVADYSAALLAELRRRGRVEANPRSCDLALYHLGNNRLHAEIYRRAIKHPGVVVLHDAVLHHFLLGQLAEGEYVSEFVYNYGEWNRGLARDLWRGRAASASDDRYFRYPMLKRAAGVARAIVVHNPAAARAVREHAPDATVREIPHLFAAPDLPSEAEALRYRDSLGLSGAFVFAVFGYLRESKRLFSVLAAFEALRREFPRAALLIAGEFVSSDLERAIAPLLAAPGIVRLPFLSERDFWLAARMTDACINLRYPSAGESSGIAVRLMGIGKPVLVTESEEYARLPADACLRIAPGAAECDALFEHMRLLAAMPAAAEAIGARAAAHIAAHHRLDTVGEQFWKVLVPSL
ncbi:MAG: glycosyltransferase [Acidobacteria bacterium]|nr:glycosyltransferase [Acidobacteriota bacterium]